MRVALLTLFALVFCPVVGRPQTLDQCDDAGNTSAAQDRLSGPTVPGVVHGCNSQKLPVDNSPAEGSTTPPDARDQRLLPSDSEPAPLGEPNPAAVTSAAPAESAGLSAPPSASLNSPGASAPPPAQSRRGAPLLAAAASLIFRYTHLRDTGGIQGHGGYGKTQLAKPALPLLLQR
jgi:hypothetical protein